MCKLRAFTNARKGDQDIVTEGAKVVEVDQILNEAKQTGRYIKVGLLMANSPVAREIRIYLSR